VCALQEHEDGIAAGFRTVPQTSALSISGVVSLDALVLDDPAFDEPTGMVAANGLRPAGSTGVLYTRQMFRAGAQRGHGVCSSRSRGGSRPSDAPGLDRTRRCGDRAHRAPAQGMIRCGDDGKKRGADGYRGRCRPQSEGISSQGRPCYGAADRRPSGFPPAGIGMDGRVAATRRVRHACLSGARPAAFSRGNTHDPVAAHGELRGTASLTGGAPCCERAGASRQRRPGWPNSNRSPGIAPTCWPRSQGSSSARLRVRVRVRVRVRARSTAPGGKRSRNCAGWLVPTSR
jgi:hypothetical protein